ncbi:MAG: iron uptake transporter permease EfeU [Microbacteriaceae bacterium]
MLANFLIGLREGLEASIIIGILIAFAVRTDRRDVIPAIWRGVLAALGLSMIVGLILLYGVKEASDWVEVFLAGTLSIAAAGLITWMVFWMAKTARNLKGHLEGSLQASMGKNTFAVATVGFLAVAREGIETALFMWASVRASGESAASAAIVIVGILVAVGLGWLFYLGALKINLRVFFQWTGGALIVVAAGILAYGVHEFQEIGLLPAGPPIYDASEWLGKETIIGALLYGLISYRPNPSLLELVTWASFLIPTMTLFIRSIAMPAKKKAEPVSSQR